MSQIDIRKFEWKDRQDVRRISCETSFPETDRSLFIDDDEILSDALTIYYTDYEPESCFVAVDGDKVVGYIIGTKDVLKMERIFSKHILPKFIKKAFCRGLFMRMKTWRLFFNMAVSALKGEFAAPHFCAQYPAMLHINIDKDYRRRQLGKRLICHYVNFLKEQRANGVHFGAISNGAKAFFLKSGFELLHESKRSYLKYRTGKTLPFYIFGKILILFLFVFIGAGCAGPHKTIIEATPHQFVFPKSFLWGAATSAHQVEGNNTNNDWWEWEQTRPPQERSGRATDEWNRFEEDFKLAQDLGHTAHRFSIEWSRIEPQEGQWDSASLDHYAQVIRSLKKKGMEPIVTLNHFTLPLWLARQGGWYSDKTPGLFARYVEKVARALGSDVHYWMTLNEPGVYTYKAYMVGEWPPGVKSPEKGLKVFKNLLLGHVLAYEKIKKVYILKAWRTPLVGIAQSVLIFRACSDTSLRDRVAARFRHWMFNHLFVQALVRGQAYCIGLFSIHLPEAKTLDFIGLNYYTRDFVRHNGFGFPGILGQACTATVAQNRQYGQDNFLSWEIYPKGLYTFLKDFSRYKLPLLVSENGIGTDDDTERSAFVVGHLKAMAQAMQEGAPVIGYLYWSLLDNYEWAEGFVPRFGLIAVDYTTQKRTVRQSAIKLEEIIRSGQLSY